jgi:hypothetical protein
MPTTSFDTPVNLAYSTVATAPSPATSGTSLVVAAGTGSRFAVGPATLAPASTTPTAANSEIVRITAISTDTLTITRAQESTTARTVTTSWVIYQGPTAKTITDITTAVGLLETPAQQTQTGTSYTLVIGDVGKVVTMNNASANTLTIPANASVAFPVGTTIIVEQIGAGQTTVAITSDTLNYYSPTSAGTCQTPGRYAAVTLFKRASTTWDVWGAK